MQLVVMVVGALAEMSGWWLVASRRRSVWRLMPLVLGVMGIAAVLVRPPVAATRVADLTAALIGVGSGLALFAATRVFVWLASRWDPFRRDVAQKYREAQEVSLGRSLVLSLLIMVPAEELFWRGLFQGHLSASTTIGIAAVTTWICYVVANAPSRSLPILAGAMVGGGLWTWLAWWSGGVLASLGSHILWTGLMLILPPGTGTTVGRRSEDLPSDQPGDEPER
ncbi:MAG TPA: CPBP family intramembrane glutamic endopeptidase [Actinomycetota bacterium]